LAHGAVGQRPPSFYQKLQWSLLEGVAELLRHLDVLAGRRLVYLAKVERQASGTWLVDCQQLIGESPKRLEESYPLTAAESAALLPQRIYLQTRVGPDFSASSQPGAMALKVRSLHPLVIFHAESGKVGFLNGRKQTIEYVCYTDGVLPDP